MCKRMKPLKKWRVIGSSDMAAPISDSDIIIRDVPGHKNRSRDPAQPVARHFSLHTDAAPGKFIRYLPCSENRGIDAPTARSLLGVADGALRPAAGTRQTCWVALLVVEMVATPPAPQAHAR